MTNSEKAGVKKPNPLIFEFAITSAKVKKEQVVMIGDSYDADIEGAMNVGMDVIFFNEFKTEINLSIPNVFHLSEIKQYL